MVLRKGVQFLSKPIGQEAARQWDTELFCLYFVCLVSRERYHIVIAEPAVPPPNQKELRS
jgi:hypothetical protein